MAHALVVAELVRTYLRRPLLARDMPWLAKDLKPMLKELKGFKRPR